MLSNQEKKIFDGVLRNCNDTVYNEFTDFLPDLKRVINHGVYNKGYNLLLLVTILKCDFENRIR